MDNTIESIEPGGACPTCLPERDSLLIQLLGAVPLRYKYIDIGGDCAGHTEQWRIRLCKDVQNATLQQQQKGGRGTMLYGNRFSLNCFMVESLKGGRA